MPHHKFQKLVVITTVHNLENSMHHLGVLASSSQIPQNQLLWGNAQDDWISHALM
jgi:hypothetical protein